VVDKAGHIPIANTQGNRPSVPYRYRVVARGEKGVFLAPCFNS